MSQEIESQIIGKTIKEADAILEKSGKFTRICKLDGEHLILTMEYNTDRVNVGVVDGLITQVWDCG